jgi:endonuclease/exonuclease/phosphatase family metal-dependent hydrolase
MRLRVLLAAVLGLATTAALGAPAADAAVPTPSAFTAVTATPGPRAGEITFTWKQDGRNTTGFVIETGLTTFSPVDSSQPLHGRGSKTFAVGRTSRSVTLTASQVASAGAALGSGNHLFYRVKAVNVTRSGSTTRWWPYLQSVGVRPTTATAGSTLVRVGTYNVHTANTQPGVRAWSTRVGGIVDEIKRTNPGVVGLQELGITPANGSSQGSLTATTQAQSLVNTLASRGVGKYRLVRTTRYVKPGTASAIQGARILYDSSRYRLVTSCPETTDGSPWSSACIIPMPMRPGDSEWVRRHAAYATLQDLRTGRQFMVVSAHLDQRHSTTASTDRIYEQLRADQVATVMNRVNQLNTAGLPVVFTGDINTYQSNVGGYLAHDALVRGGYYDTSAAFTQVNLRYSTVNKFACTVAVPMVGKFPGWGSRIDVVMVKGLGSAVRWENALVRTDCARPTDHNLVLADIRI